MHQIIFLLRLTVGYIYSSVKNKIYPLEECDMELYQHGEFGTPPKDYAFSFKAGKICTIRIIIQSVIISSSTVTKFDYFNPFTFLQNIVSEDS